MEKYYTPTIEEFHVGFEFESRYTLFSRDKEWVKCKLDENNTWFTEEWYVDAVPTEFRVKYLDQEDIESLGFELYSKGNFSNDYKKQTLTLNHHVASKKVNIWCSYDDCQFSGTIKNKSELKRILKQIGYE